MEKKRLLVALVFALALYATFSKAQNASVNSFSLEYQAGEEGKILAQILNDTDSPQNSANCYVTLYYPNNSVFVSGNMVYLPTSHGLYTYTFTASSTLGVYAASINCSDPEAYGFSQFRVSSWARDIEDTVKSQTRVVNEAVAWWGRFFNSGLFLALILLAFVLIFGGGVVLLRRRQEGKVQ
nr:hypothetical protein 17 [bacterium]